jgi:hypothetical protein
MSFRRYEIILPTRYNDGTPVEDLKFSLTAEELVNRFGAATYAPQTLHGIWTHQGQRYEDDSVRVFADVEDTPENTAFFVQWKELLKERFRQIDIWIVSYDIRIM